jgi:hypothetical protein
MLLDAMQMADRDVPTGGAGLELVRGAKSALSESKTRRAAFSHRAMKSWLMIASGVGRSALPAYQNPPQIFDFARNAAYNAAGLIQVVPVFIGLIEFRSKISTLFPINTLKAPEVLLSLPDHNRVRAGLNPILF